MKDINWHLFDFGHLSGLCFTHWSVNYKKNACIFRSTSGIVIKFLPKIPRNKSNQLSPF